MDKESILEPTAAVQIKGGVSALSWLNGETLVAGCAEDHAIKLVDVDNAGVIKQSILTDYKSPLTIDSSQDSLILAGCEDGIVRLFDTRASR